MMPLRRRPEPTPDPAKKAKVEFEQVLQRLVLMKEKLDSKVFNSYAEPDQHMKGEHDGNAH